MARAEFLAEKRKGKILKEKLKNLDSLRNYAEKNNLSISDLSMYLNGDTTESKLLENLLKK